MFTYEKLTGLSRDRVVGAIEPVLRTHGLAGVELIWQSEAGGKVLRVTVENLGVAAETANEGPSADGLTLSVCAQVSREISAVLDEDDIIAGKYHLEVGSPGLERPLYVPADYSRFVGRRIQLKLSSPVDHEYSLEGQLCGITEQGAVRIEVKGEEREVPFDIIRTSQLVIDWKQSGKSSSRSKGSSASRWQ